MRFSSGTTARLLIAIAGAFALFLIILSGPLGIDAFVATVGTGVLLVLFLASTNGYQENSRKVPLLIGGLVSSAMLTGAWLVDRRLRMSGELGDVPAMTPPEVLVWTIAGISVGYVGHRLGVLVRYRDPPLRPSTAGAIHLLAATGIGVCLFFVLYSRFLGSVGFFLAISGGVLLIVLLAGHNGYDHGIQVTSVLIATVLMTSVLAGLVLAGIFSPISDGGGIVDKPSSGVGTFIFVVPGIVLGLVAHRIGRYVDAR